MQSAILKQVVDNALEDVKAQQVTWMDVTGQSDFTDYMVVASGTSNRHVKAVVDRVIEHAGDQGVTPIGVEGVEDGEWILIDLVDIVVHVMLPKAREFYDLERLWTLDTHLTESTV